MLAKSKRTLYVFYTETSERQTKAKVTGIGTLCTTEFVTLVTGTTINVPARDRIRVPGTNANDSLGPFERPKKEQTWHVKHGDKGKLYGCALVLSSGKVDGDAGADRTQGQDRTTWCR